MAIVMYTFDTPFEVADPRTVDLPTALLFHKHEKRYIPPDKEINITPIIFSDERTILHTFSRRTKDRSDTVAEITIFQKTGVSGSRERAGGSTETEKLKHTRPVDERRPLFTLIRRRKKEEGGGAYLYRIIQFVPGIEASDKADLSLAAALFAPAGG
jgi:hypothetical protein